MTRMFVGGIPYEYKEDDFRSLLDGEGAGYVKELSMMWPGDSRLSACASLLVDDEYAARVMETFEGKKIHGHYEGVRARVCRKRRRQGSEEVVHQEEAHHKTCTLYFKIFKDAEGIMDVMLLRRVLGKVSPPIKVLIEPRKKHSNKEDGFTQGWAVMESPLAAEKCIRKLSKNVIHDEMYIEMEKSEKPAADVMVTCNTQYAWDKYSHETSTVLHVAGLNTATHLKTGKPLFTMEVLEKLVGCFGDVSRVKFIKDSNAALVELRVLDHVQFVKEKLHQVSIYGHKVRISNSNKNSLTASKADDPFYLEVTPDHHRYSAAPPPRSYHPTDCLKVTNIPQSHPPGPSDALLKIFSTYGATAATVIASPEYRPATHPPCMSHCVVDFPDVSAAIDGLLSVHGESHLLDGIDCKLFVSFSDVSCYPAERRPVKHNVTKTPDEGEDDPDEMAF